MKHNFRNGIHIKKLETRNTPIYDDCVSVLIFYIWNRRAVHALPMLCSTTGQSCSIAIVLLEFFGVGFQEITNQTTLVTVLRKIVFRIEFCIIRFMSQEKQCLTKEVKQKELKASENQRNPIN